MMLETGKITEEYFDKEEKLLLDRLDRIQDAKQQEADVQNMDGAEI